MRREQRPPSTIPLMLLSTVVVALSLLLLFPITGFGSPLEDRMAAGEDQLATRDYGQAAASFRAATEADPNFSAAYVSLGRALLLQVQQTGADPALLDQAAEALHKAISLTPGIPEAHGILGQVELERGQYAQALGEFQAELGLSSAAFRAEVYCGKGRAYLGLGRPVEAVNAFRNALEWDPNYADAMYYRAMALHSSGKQQEAIRELDKLHKILEDYSFENIRINRLKERGQRDPEITEETMIQKYYHAAQFLEREGQWPEVFGLKARCYHDLGDYALARVAYHQALKPVYQGNPNDSDIRTAVVRELFDEIDRDIRVEGKVIDPFRALQAADNQLKEILDLDAEFAPALELRGEIYLVEAKRYKVNRQMGIVPKTYDDAIESLKKAVEVYGRRRNQTGVPESLRSPANLARAYCNLGRAYLGKGDPASALPHLQQAVETDPANLEANVALAEAQGKSGQVNAAVALLNQVFEVNPDFLQALVAKAQIEYDAGHFTEAALDSERATAIDPKSAEAHILSGHAYYAEGSWGTARRHFRQAINLIPPSPLITLADQRAELYYLVGRSYLNEDIPENALEAFNQALSLNTSYPEAQVGLGDAYVQLKDYLAAERAYQVAREIQEGVSDQIKAQMDLALGRLYIKMGRPTKAYALFLSAVRTDPQNTQAGEELRQLEGQLQGSAETPSNS